MTSHGPSTNKRAARPSSWREVVPVGVVVAGAVPPRQKAAPRPAGVITPARDGSRRNASAKGCRGGVATRLRRSKEACHRTPVCIRLRTPPGVGLVPFQPRDRSAEIAVAAIGACASSCCAKRGDLPLQRGDACVQCVRVAAACRERQDQDGDRLLHLVSLSTVGILRARVCVSVHAPVLNISARKRSQRDHRSFS